MPKPKSKRPPSQVASTPSQCLALDEDEETRCMQPPTHGTPRERCQTHYGQYCTMTKRYKDASKIVDDMRKGSSIPTKAEISSYTDFHSAMQKARWMRQYVEAIRVEKTGREIHHQRFFLKMDDGHKIRLKLLAKQMIIAVEILDAVQAQAFNLHIAKHPASEWVKEFQANSSSNSSELADSTMPPRKGASTVAGTKNPEATATAQPETSFPSSHEDDDLIDIKIRAEKARLLRALEPFLEREAMMQAILDMARAHGEQASENPGIIHFMTIMHNIMLQYARRILFHDPVLSLKALNKVSFKDLILDDDFSVKDLEKFFELWTKRTAIGLLWWKDSTLEAFAMLSSDGKPNNAANVGDPKDRFPMVGGWIFNRPHKQTMSNEAWWHLIKSLDPPANIENRFMRACNNFDDLHTFLSLCALGLVDPPSFCTKCDDKGEDSQVSRKHLSLCGVVVADLTSSPGGALGPLPSIRRAKRRGCITWAEVESRSYMFGAVRNEPDQFTDAFLNELRARPDLFHVLTRSDTDPGRKVETFGVSPNEQLVQVRSRSFEAPLAPLDNRPLGPDNWVTNRSAVDILYGRKPVEGYLIAANRPGSGGWLFRFKKFPVKYFVILDPTPGRHVNHLARQVAWAALRAHKLAEGKYNEKAYGKASDVLFQNAASERLSWMPESYGGWQVTNLMGE